MTRPPTGLTARKRAMCIENITRVLIQLSWLAQKQFTQSVAQHELTLPQFLTLAFLVKAQQHCPMNQLAEATHQDAATMTGIVDRLERLGLVERTRSLSDRRVVLVYPTPQAITLLATIKDTRDQMMRQLFESFEDEMLIHLDEHLEQLWRAFEGQARGSNHTCQNPSP